MQSFTALGKNLFDGKVKENLVCQEPEKVLSKVNSGISSTGGINITKQDSSKINENSSSSNENKSNNTNVKSTPIFMDEVGNVASASSSTQINDFPPGVDSNIINQEKEKIQNINSSTNTNKNIQNENNKVFDEDLSDFNQTLYTMKEGEKLSYLESEKFNKNATYSKNEFNDLANLLNVKSSTNNKNSDEFELDLFKGDSEVVIQVDHCKKNKYSELFSQENFKKEEEDGDDDLLDMMDKAGLDD